MSNEKKRTTRKVLVVKRDNQDLTIDEDDYIKVKDLLLNSGIPASQVWYAVGIRENDPDRRVYKLVFPYSFYNSIRPLPSSIWQFQNLEELQLKWGTNFVELPKKIGSMTNLKKLDISHTSVKTLPKEIGKLTKLNILNLTHTSVKTLPTEIGELDNLKELHMCHSSIESLPPSIGCLKKLNKLDLSHTHNLIELPKEIGNLASLRVLNMFGSNARTLPSSVGQLKSLEVFELPNDLSHLPEEMGNLTGLVVLVLRTPTIESLPVFLEKLTNLRILHVSKHLGAGQRPSASLCELVKCCKFLGFLGRYLYSESKELQHLLACNRARFRMGPHVVNDATGCRQPKMWPAVLKHAVHAFDGYEHWHCSRSVPSPDAIYWLLLDSTESFLAVLLNRKTINTNAWI